MSIRFDPEFPDTMTLGVAREKLRRFVHEPHGHICPLCTQHAQVYRWTFYSTAAAALLLFVRLGATERPVHSRELKAQGHQGQGDVSRLRLWGLAEEEKVRRPDGGRAGYWQITEKGEAFARGSVMIPRHCFVYDGRALGFSEERVSIHESLGTKFDYRELMEGTG